MILENFLAHVKSPVMPFFTWLEFLQEFCWNRKKSIMKPNLTEHNLPEIFFQENLVMISFFRWTQWVFNIHQKWSEIWFMFGSILCQSNAPKASHNWLNVKWMVSHYVKILKGKGEIPKIQNGLFSYLFFILSQT